MAWAWRDVGSRVGDACVSGKESPRIELDPQKRLFPKNENQSKGEGRLPRGSEASFNSAIVKILKSLASS